MIYYSKGITVKRYDYSLVNPWKDNEIPPEPFLKLIHYKITNKVTIHMGIRE